MNVQALVSAVDTDALTEVVAETVNLNEQIDVETAAPPPSLDRTFGNDIVAIDANLAGDTFLIVSRGGNQVFRARLDADGKLNILNAAGPEWTAASRPATFRAASPCARMAHAPMPTTRPISR